MAQTVVLAEHTYDRFYLNESFGVYSAVAIGKAELIVGEEYSVIWDGETFICAAQDASAFSEGSVLLGNALAFGLSGNNEPFIILSAPYADNSDIISLTDTDANGIHTVAIYKDEPDSGGDDDVENGDEIVLKYFSGEEKKFSGIEMVELKTSDGGTQLFSKGEAVENVPIVLDFSEGDQIVTAPDGMLVKSAVIQTPPNLVPENIPEGIDIAGILGTRKDGGGLMEPVMKRGYYTATTTGSMYVTHNLGMLPDYVLIASNASVSSSLAINSVAAFSEEMVGDVYNQTLTIQGTASGSTMQFKSSIYEKESTVPISEVTPTRFKVGGSYGKHVSGGTYQWLVIGGWIDHKYIEIKLSLDGEGFLILSGGVPEFEQINVYVDGVLAKTVDYVHGDEFVIDLSDVASELKEYTVTVEGVGESLEETYPLRFYDTVTGYIAPISGSCGESVNYSLYGDGTLRIYGTGAMADYSGASGQPWYSMASSIKSVVVEDGVTRIGSQSFRQLTNMTNISIADSVTSYGTSAFLGSTALSSITISANVTTINAYAFNECTGLKSAYFEGTLEQWCNINFGGTGSNPCFVGNATLYIGGETVVNAVIPETVTTLNNHVFTNCKTLASVTMHNGIKSIGSRAFYGCSNLSNIVMSNSVTAIGNYAFYNCSALANITIPDGVTSIKEYTFSGAALASIVVPDGVTEILWRAFQNCAKLQSATIGSAVSLIGDNAFYGCSALTSATFKDTTTWVRNSSQTSTTGTTISSSYLAIKSTAATYLRSTYVSYWWHKS